MIFFCSTKTKTSAMGLSPRQLFVFFIFSVTLVSALEYKKIKQNLAEVPSDIPATTTEINLSYNAITQIENDPFHQLVNLVLLKLTDNDIISIGDNVLCKTQIAELSINKNKLTTFPNVTCLADTLITVDFGDNEIVSVDQTILESLHQLEEISLDGSYLADVPDFSFKEFVEISVVLTMIDDFTPHWQKLRTTKKLKFGGSFPPVPDFREMNNTITETLEFDRVSFTSMPDDAFNNLTQLNKLTFLCCEFDKLPTIASTTTERITTLKFYNNENYILNTADVEPYINLKGLYLYDQDLFEIPHLPLLSLRYATFNNGQLSGTLTRQIIEKLFDGAPQLSRLTLNENQFTGIEDMGDTLCGRNALITIKYNSIVCDCALNWIGHLDSSCGKFSFGDLHPCQVEGQTLSPEWMNNTLCPSTETIDTTTQQTVYNTTGGTADGTTDDLNGTTDGLNGTTDVTDGTTNATTNATTDRTTDGTTNGTTDGTTDASDTQTDRVTTISDRDFIDADWFVTMINIWNDKNGQLVSDGKLHTCGITGWNSKPWYHITFPSLTYIRGITVYGK